MQETTEHQRAVDIVLEVLVPCGAELRAQGVNFLLCWADLADDVDAVPAQHLVLLCYRIFVAYASTEDLVECLIL